MAKRKKWQNLLYNKCPLCGEILVTRVEKSGPLLGRIFFDCPDKEEHFGISARKFAEILQDETHVMRRHLSKDELALLNAAVFKK